MISARHTVSFRPQESPLDLSRTGDLRPARRDENDADHSDTEPGLCAGADSVAVLCGFAFLVFPPTLNPDLLPSAFQREPANCGLVLCGLDHTLFHFAQAPFLLALALFGYRAYRVMRRDQDYGVSEPGESEEFAD